MIPSTVIYLGSMVKGLLPSWNIFPLSVCDCLHNTETSGYKPNLSVHHLHGWYMQCQTIKCQERKTQWMKSFRYMGCYIGVIIQRLVSIDISLGQNINPAQVTQCFKTVLEPSLLTKVHSKCPNKASRSFCDLIAACLPSLLLLFIQRILQSNYTDCALIKLFVFSGCLCPYGFSLGCFSPSLSVG